MPRTKRYIYLSVAVFTLIAGFFVGTFLGPELITTFGKIFNQPEGTEVSKFTKETSNKKVIVFVHGVTGTPSGTWVSTNNGGKTYWPDLIKGDKRLEDYDIFVASYFTPQLVAGPTIAAIAQVVHQDLVKNQILPDGRGKSRYNEVIFICHSMGNLVIRDMMVTHPLPPPGETNIRIPLILSLAAPSAGSELADFVERFSDNPTFKEMGKLETNSFLQLLNGVWMQSAFDTEIACAYETKPTHGINKIIVKKDSATAVCTRKDYHEFEADHISIVKPDTMTHPVHAWVVEEIQRPRTKAAWELPRWTNNEVIIGGKDYGESNLQAAMIALVLKSDPKLRELKVKTQDRMGHASRVFSSLVNRNIDIYPEYDGSLLYEYLRNPLPGSLTATGSSSPQKPGDTNAVNIELQKSVQTLNMRYFPHFGFNNPYVLVMKRAKAEELGIWKDGKVSMSDVATKSKKNLILIADQEFIFRNEWSELRERYKLKFKDFAQVKHEHIFDQVREGRAHNMGIVAVAFGSDPELHVGDRDLVTIEDDKGVLPDYYPAPLVDKLLLRRFPDIEPVLKKLDGIMTITEAVNLLKKYEKLSAAAVNKSDDTEQNIMESVAQTFLMEKGVLPKQ